MKYMESIVELYDVVGETKDAKVCAAATLVEAKITVMERGREDVQAWELLNKAFERVMEELK